MRIPNLLLSTIILFFSNLIVRILGFFYKIFLARIIGEYGLGIYHILFNVLMIFVALTTTGIPTTLSFMTAKNKALKDKHNTNVLFISTLYVSFLISFFMALLVSVNSKSIAQVILNNEKMNLFVLAICPSIVILTLSNVLRGYYYGIKNILVPAISIVLEQISRIIFVMLIVNFINNENLNCYMALIGISVGEIISIFYLIFNIYKDNDIKNNYTINTKDFLNSSIETLKTSIPLTCSKIANVLLHSISSLIIPSRLILTGISYQQSISIYGVISGMVMPLIYLPFTLSSALVVNLVPNISHELTVKNFKRMKIKINSSLILTLLVGIIFSICFYIFPQNISNFLFEENELVSKYIKSMCLVPIFLSLNQTLSSILHSIGREVLCSTIAIVSTIVQIFFIYILVPSIGIYGYIYTISIVSIILTLIYYFILIKDLHKICR